MGFKSLKTRILFLIVATMVVTLAAIIILTLRDYERTVLEAGEESAKNALHLVMLDIENEYRGLQYYKKSILTERREQLKNVMAIVFSGLEDYYRISRQGLLSPPRARQGALNWIKTIRYGNDDYFFVYNTKLRAISHPDPEFMGKLLLDFKDINGNDVGRHLRDIALKQGAGFYRYWWKRLQSQTPVEKLAYVRYFPQWQWIVGTGVYINDLEVQVKGKLQEILSDLTLTFEKLRLAKTGYVFIFNGKKQLVVNPGLSKSEIDSFQDREKILQGLMEAARHPHRPFTYTLTTKKQGSRLKEAYVEYFAPLDWYVVCSIFKDEIYLPARQLALTQVFLITVIGLVCIVLAYPLVNRISRPLKELAAHAKDLPSQDFTRPAQPGTTIPGLYLGYRDEVGQLAASLDFMESSLRARIQELVATTSAKERFESELKIGREIQMHILPKVFPPFPHRSDVDIYAVIEPAREVGGDFYDFFFLDEQRLCFAIGDVSDKGVPASLYMAVTKTLIKAVAQQGHSPGIILARLNNELSRDNPSAMFVSVFLALLDTDTGQVVYANGGHNPPLVRRAAGGADYLPLAAGPVVGAVPGSVYKTEKLQLSPQDSLFLYTDGITEAVNREGEFFGETRLQDLLASLPGEDAEETVETVRTGVQEFAARMPQADDLTMLMVRFRGKG